MKKFTARSLRIVLPLSMLAFFMSGFSALLYQVAWQRMLVLFTGSDVRSVTLVITAYLAGLGVGSFMGLRLADSLSPRMALRAYGLTDILIAVFAWFSVGLLSDVLYPLSLGIERSGFFLWVLLFAFLLLPTTLMGLSLPLISRAVADDAAGVAGRVSVFNGVNILGAATGCLIAGWLLAPFLGFDVTVKLGAVISLLAGVMVVVAAQGMPAHAADTQKASVRGSLYGMNASVAGWCVLFFVSGFIAISLEIIWFRILAVLLDADAKLYSSFLFVFLLCYGVGNVWGSRHSFISPWRTFLSLQVAMMVWVLVTVGALLLWGSRYQWGADALYRWIPAMLVGVPAVLMGAVFPVMQSAVQSDLAHVGARVSWLQLSNLAGNVLAGLLTGFILLEYAGTPFSIKLLSGLTLLFAALLVHDAWRSSAKKRMVAVCGVLTMVLMMALMLPVDVKFWGGFHRAGQGTVFRIQEDASGVSALRVNESFALFTVNGEPQGGIPFAAQHVYMGAVAALLHPDPRDALVIGMGSAGTAFGVGAQTVLENITVVELISSEFPLLHDYERDGKSPALSRLFSDPRFHWLHADGRRYVTSRSRQYDLIQADAIQPWNSGSGFLYSREYFALMASRLKPGGIMAQWQPTARVEATFVSVFPYAIKLDNHLLLGSNEPMTLDAQSLHDRLFSPEVQAYLQLGGASSEQLWAMAGQGRVLMQWEPGSDRLLHDLNTDWKPADEYRMMYFATPLTSR
ncbi:MAG TPA: hypothetical protein VIM96_00670 [Pseudomonadales bacterium]